MTPKDAIEILGYTSNLCKDIGAKVRATELLEVIKVIEDLDFIRHEYEDLVNQIKVLKASKETLRNEIIKMKSDAQWKHDGMMGCQMGQS